MHPTLSAKAHLPARRRLFILAGALAWMALPETGIAQDAWPSKPITIVVPFTPGGVTDTGARVVAKAFSETLGVSVVVENRGGAGGIRAI